MPVSKVKPARAARSAVIRFNNWICNNVDKPVQDKIGFRPAQLEDTIADLKELMSILANKPTANVESGFLPLLKRAIIHERRDQAFDIERRSGFTFNHEIRTRLKESLKPLSTLMRQKWFASTTVAGCPRLTDFLSIQVAEDILRKNRIIQLPDRVPDEKFRILNAPSLFHPDMNYYRATCELRGRPFSVAYVDIDDFKQFNSEFSEPIVDRDVLPRFMSSLEAHLYSHGSAYRYGGDEYAILLPNMSGSQATGVLTDFQVTLQDLKYFQIERRIQVSIGVVEVREDSFLTNHEIEQGAAQAKKFAKKKGKNRIAMYQRQSCAVKDLYILKTR